jgi:hypothetical protein
MYLYSRRRQLNPAQARKAVAFAVETGKRASTICGMEISVWTTVMSADAGVISWATMVERLTDLEVAMDKLAADGSFNDFIEQNDGLFVGSLADTLAQVVSGAPDPAAAPPTYATIVQATCANGHLAAGMAGGVEIAETATRIGGMPTMFLAAATGEYGGVAWLTGAPDLASLEAAEAKVNNDASFIGLADRVSPAYLPHASNTIYRRIG